MKIKRSSLMAVLGLLTASFWLAGCNLVAQPADVSSRRPTEVLQGVVEQAGMDRYVLRTRDQGNVELEGKEIDLSIYEGEEVEVEGEYSGSTLFVDRVF